MPVNVPLIELCKINGTEHLWPQMFHSFVVKILENPNEKTTWLVTADWLNEEEMNEPLLARAFRYIGNHGSVQVTKKGDSFWSITGLPSSLDYHITGEYGATVAEVAAQLAESIKKALAELE